jgi:arabinofuranan 3-O-arabinosyltransferase
VRLDGWKQGWILPAGSRGLVTLTYGPQAQYDAALWGGGLGLLAVVIVAFLLPVRGRRRPAAALRLSAFARSGAAIAPESSGAASASTAAVPAAESPGAAPESSGAAAESAGAALSGSIGSHAALAVALCLTCLLGLWVGGYVGAVLLPVLTLGFGVALALRARSRVARRLTEPLVTAGLLVAAAASAAVGERLYLHPGSGSLVKVLSDIVPQVACMIIVGRLAAALLTQPFDQPPR